MRRPHAFRSSLCLALSILLAGLAACIGPGANRSPIASFVASPESGYAPLAVQLDARASRDPDGDPLTYEWTFDGAETASGPVVVRTFAVGTHTIELQVTDGRGGVDIATKTVAAQEVPAGYVPRSFSWSVAGTTRSCTLLIPWNLYQMYKARIRNTAAETYAYGDYVSDPLDDPTLRDYADIFWAQADRDWILDGAAVHVSMVGFDDGTETSRELDGVAQALPVWGPCPERLHQGQRNH